VCGNSKQVGAGSRCSVLQLAREEEVGELRLSELHLEALPRALACRLRVKESRWSFSREATARRGE
jgi:hypothetical protein